MEGTEEVQQGEEGKEEGYKKERTSVGRKQNSGEGGKEVGKKEGRQGGGWEGTEEAQQGEEGREVACKKKKGPV